MKYPNEIYHHRNVENLPGMTYIPTEKTTIFAEDIVKVADEVTAIETELGTGPKGLNVTVAARLNAMDEMFDNHSAAISELQDKHEYDVGDIFLSFNPANPAVRKGYGVWTLAGAGRTLVGVDAAQSEFNTVRKAGGNKYMQAHTHNTVSQFYTYVGSGGENGIGAGTSVTYSDRAVVGAGRYGKTTNAGSGNSENLQPYLTCYIWERTA